MQVREIDIISMNDPQTMMQITQEYTRDSEYILDKTRLTIDVDYM